MAKVLRQFWSNVPFKKYEDYINSFINIEDTRYFRNLNISQKMVQYGYRSSNTIYSEEEFLATKKQKKLEIVVLTIPRPCASANINIKDPILRELAERELLNINKTIATIIFLEHTKLTGKTLTGFIDYEQSLRRSLIDPKLKTDWRAIFNNKKKLIPKPIDLSYFDHYLDRFYCNDSDNFTVRADLQLGLVFMHKGDHKKIYFNTRKRTFTNCKCSIHFSDRYGHVVLYDHIVRVKN